MLSHDETVCRPRVVIIGAGFGGLSAAKALAKTNFAVTLIDRHNYHLFSRCSIRSLPRRCRLLISRHLSAALSAASAMSASFWPKSPGSISSVER
jgi:flavin-dependent dehydrogenase